MNRRKLLACTLAAAGVLASLVSVNKVESQNAPQSSSGKPAAANKATQPAQGDDDRGQVVFQQNCSRCHNAPEGFSPRISGTVVRHMRMRASLSEEDEKALLRFFNP